MESSLNQELHRYHHEQSRINPYSVQRLRDTGYLQQFWDWCRIHIGWKGVAIAIVVLAIGYWVIFSEDRARTGPKPPRVNYTKPKPNYHFSEEKDDA